MNNSTKDDGVIAALLKRFETQRLPRALSIKKKVDAGEVLATHDLSFLQEVIEDSKSIEPMLERHPEYVELVTKAFSLYKDIMEKSLENEKKT